MEICLVGTGAVVATGAVYFGWKWFAPAEPAPVVDVPPVVASFARCKTICLMGIGSTVFATGVYYAWKLFAPVSLVPVAKFAFDSLASYLVNTAVRRLLTFSVLAVRNPRNARNNLPILNAFSRQFWDETYAAAAADVEEVD